MTENFSRKAFFDQIRESIYGGRIPNNKAVQGIEAIFDACVRHHVSNPVWIAAILGNVRLEVGRNMYPVREGFKNTDRESIAHVAELHRQARIKKNYAIPDPRTGLSYYGRGQIQLTHAGNYMEAGRRIGVDLYKFPDKVLEVGYSARIAVLGSVEGWWRGNSQGRHTLARYIKDGKVDFRGLRNIVNGDRREGELKHYTDLFLSALIEAGKFPADVPEPSKPDKGAIPMANIFTSLLGGGGGLNIIRGLMAGFAGAFGIEVGTGGDVPLIDTTQMGLKDMLVPILLWVFAEKMGIDFKNLQTPSAVSGGAGGIFSSLLGGGGGLNIIRGLMAGLAGVFGVEAGFGGDVPLVDAGQMGLKDILVPGLLWFLAEKMGVDMKQIQPPPATETDGN